MVITGYNLEVNNLYLEATSTVHNAHQLDPGDGRGSHWHLAQLQQTACVRPEPGERSKVGS